MEERPTTMVVLTALIVVAKRRLYKPCKVPDCLALIICMYTVTHGFNGGKQLKCELEDDKYYKCTNIMGDYPKEVHSKGFNKGEYKLECPIGPNGSNMEVAKANATQVEGEKRNWFVQFILDPIKNVTSGWNNTKV
uniref:Uncharacterized protein n=1 Tax=Meloidogyne javanica TaxID=6303 RepID=A0A915NBC1_MELJA